MNDAHSTLKHDRSVQNRVVSSKQHTQAAGNGAVQTNPQGPGNVVIAGAGIMGCATAYYLSKLGVAATVVEKGEVACASSGKAGGFLALDWSDGGPVGPLARLSYFLHKTLASELGQDTGYREVRTFSVAASAKPGQPSHAQEPFCCRAKHFQLCSTYHQ